MRTWGTSRPSLVFLALIALLLVLAAESGRLYRAEALPAGRRIPIDFAPVVDHHQHLFSPSDAALVNDPPRMTGTLSPGIDRLLQFRAAHWNDAAALQSLLTDSPAVFDNTNYRWVRDPKEAALWLSSRYNQPYRLEPFAISTKDGSAHVTGYFVIGVGDDSRNAGYFYWELRAVGTEDWRIATEEISFPAPRYQAPITSDDLIEMLDLAHIDRAIILSAAFWHDGPNPRSPDPYPLVQAENDWTAQQVVKYPKRLVAFCSFNPLAEYALKELRRCATSKVFRGLKLSFASSGVDLSNATHVAKVHTVFQAADGYGLPIVVHAHGTGPYGQEQARVMLDQLVAAAPHVTVQIAHLWGGENYSGDALQVYAEAVARREPETRNLYFDVAEVAFVAGNSPDIMRTIAMRIRQIGLGRILYGSDAALNGRLKPRESWELFCRKVPLTRSEFRTIAQNVAPYMR